jgi:hypothetical protein
MENKITLRPYQQVIVEKTCKLLRDAPRFAYLSMEVRTGKTLTALSALDCAGGVASVLFVTKKKAIEGIKKDYNALAPSYKCDFINYENLHKIVDICYDAIVFDEAHGMGAFPKPSLRAIEARRLVHHCDPYVIFLSGTPSPESYSQMYHQMWILGYRGSVCRADVLQVGTQLRQDLGTDDQRVSCTRLLQWHPREDHG